MKAWVSPEIINISRFITFRVFGFAGVYTKKTYFNSQRFAHIYKPGHLCRNGYQAVYL